MWGSNKFPVFEGSPNLYHDKEGVIVTDTRMSEVLASYNFDMYDPPSRMLGADDCPYDIEKGRVDGLLESIVNQATAIEACSFDTRKVPQNTKKEDGDHNDNDIDGCVVPTANNRDTMASRMNPLVPCFSNTYGSANPSETNLETMFQTGTWVLTDTYNKEEESQVMVIQQEEDDQVLPQGHCLKEDAEYQMVAHGENGKFLPQGCAEIIVPAEYVDQVAVQENHYEILAVPQGYSNEKCLFTGDNKDTSHVANENSEMMRVNHMNTWHSQGCQTRTSSMHSSLGQNRGSSSINRPISRKGKGMMKTATIRKHNKQEQTRRDTINQKMRTLHDLVPYHSRSVRASKELLLTDVILHIKRLQSQVETMMSMRNTMPCVMMDYPMTTDTATNTWQMSSMYSTVAHPQLDAMGSLYLRDKC